MTAASATSTLTATDLAVDHELADIALSFDFLLDVSPVNGVQAREDFLAGEDEHPTFTYRELGDELAVAARACSAWTSQAYETRPSRT